MSIQVRDKGLPMTVDEMYETFYGPVLNDTYSSFVSRRDVKWSAGNVVEESSTENRRQERPKEFRVTLAVDY